MADVGTVSSSFSGTPQWYSDYLREVSEVGRSLAQEDFTPYAGPRIAGFTPDQQTAFNMTRDAQGMWRPGFDAAQDAMAASQGALGQASQMIQQGGQFDRPTYENTYWDIYKPGVERLQEQAQRIGSQNFTNTTLADLNRNFTGTGNFGGGRHQILGADAAATAQQKIEDLSNQAWMTGRQQAMGDYLNWGKQNLQGGQQMAGVAQNQSALGKDLFGLGTAGTQAMMTDASAMANIGQQQQLMDQSNLNLAYNDWNQQRNYPWEQATNWSSLMRGQALPSLNTQSTTSIGSGAFALPNYSNPWATGINAGAGIYSGLTGGK